MEENKWKMAENVHYISRIRREINMTPTEQKKLETLIAKKILAQEILPNSIVKIDCKNDELCIEK